jgi:hypothetical protein
MMPPIGEIMALFDKVELKGCFKSIDRHFLILLSPNISHNKIGVSGIDQLS